MGICSCSRHERTIPHSCVSVFCSCAFVVSFGDCSLKNLDEGNKLGDG